MKKRILSMLLAFCMVSTMLPMTTLAASADPFTDVDSNAYYFKPDILVNDNGVTYLYCNAGSPTVTVEQTETSQIGKLDGELYRVFAPDQSEATGYLRGAPFRASRDGAIIGVIPHYRLVEVLAYDEAGYAKVKYNGGEVYVWAANLKKVDKPDAICSNWAQEILSAYDGQYVGLKGAWFGVENDYTRTITRAEMAEMLVWIMEDIYGTWSVQYTLPIVTGDMGEYWDLSSRIGFRPGRLVYWGVAPLSYFEGHLDEPATYGEAVSYLVKLMEYNQKTVDGRAKKDMNFTKAIVDSYAIGGNTASDAKCTYEQVRILKEMTNLWYDIDTLKSAVAYETSQYRADPSKKQYEGLNMVGTDTYSIQTYLSKEGSHPYLTINADGKGELQSSKPQSFKVTYLGTDQRGHYYNIQTVDGRYLAIDGMAVNGSNLIAQSQPYRWYISGGRGDFITSAENTHQKLNASGWNTNDGTPVISWFCNGGIGTDNDNYKFYFEYAK